MKNVRAKKHLGQHFLNNTVIAKKITDLLSPSAKLIVEVGPGMGALTQFLLEKKPMLELVEIDNESIIYLTNKYPQIKNNITQKDFLQINLKKKYNENFSLIGNFPYNISSQLLFKFIENRFQITELICMLQLEVAERICAKKGKKRGILSVFIQAFYNVEFCFTVKEEEFIPPPKVKSGVIKCSRNDRISLHCDENLFKQIIKTAFNQRRKTLRNALKPFTLLDSEELKSLLILRAEQLSVEDFIKITKNVKKIKHR